MVLIQQKICPELKLLAILSRPSLSDKQVQNALAIYQLIDFNVFKVLLDQHRVWSCVYSNVRDFFPEKLPQSLLNYLKKKHQKNIIQSQRQFKTCTKLLCHFKEFNIPIKILKGLPLTFKLYGDISKKHSKDLDLIIPEDKLDQAHQILISFGFHCCEFEKIPQKQKSLYFNTQKDITYRDNFGTIIELHIRLSPHSTKLSNYYLKCLFNQSYLEDIRTVEFLYLCWHGSHTLFHRLKWLLDIALYLEQLQAQTKLDTNKLISLASDLDAMRMLTVSWQLAHLLYGVKIPLKISHFHKQDIATLFLVSQCLKMLNNSKHARSIQFRFVKYFCDVLFCQHWSEKKSILLQRLKPTTNDLKILGFLPAHLSFLCYPLRPFFCFYRLFFSR